VTVRIDEITSEVALDGEAGRPLTGAPEPLGPPDDLRLALERAARDAERTRAEGYGD
jgi:hypothetical protein